jgi:thiamine phosphate synthase YjbQ (UPF0047 family)
MTARPFQASVTLSPTARSELIDVTRVLASEAIDAVQSRRRALYCSLHTTAGFVERGLASRLQHGPDVLARFIDAFRILFPVEAGYLHDALHLRSELVDSARAIEPKNGDAPLTFIGAGLRNCVTYPTQPDLPVYFIDLDGMMDGQPRRRVATVVAYDNEEVVTWRRAAVPVSRRAIDSVNLADPRLGLIALVEDLIQRHGVDQGRVDLQLAPSEQGAGLTVNEFETLLVRHDLAAILRNPLRFAALAGRGLLADPGVIRRKSLSYAAYDLVVVFKSLLDVLGMPESSIERLVARLLAAPARRFLRLRRHASFAITDGPARRLLRGVYQSPILVQWRPVPGAVREMAIRIVRFR